MVKYKNWSLNEWKSSQCLKKNLEKSFRTAGELLLKATLKNYEKLHLFYKTALVDKCLSKAKCSAIF